ncbi:MAG: RagB/SusD family nutrient uptake outer membrane protein [Chitinophagaceae bacterium]|nr:RagB/SusD family nutrient uptake outer membrane protein [Chitinophagaceae bacterium]
MKNKILLFAFFAFIFAACNKEKLSPTPPTNISDADAFGNAQRVLQQTLGMYSAVKSSNFYAGRYQVNIDIRGEEFLNLTLNVQAGLSTWEFTVSPSHDEVQLTWQEAYAAINRSNVVFEGIETSTVVSAAQKKQYQGEARFLRALCHYALVTLYARPYWDGNGAKDGIPLRLQAEISGGNNKLKRATVAEVYAQILKDLDFAETNLPLTYASPYDRTTRAHRNTAIALKTRVYLSMQQYDKVIVEANKIVSAAAPFTATTGVPHQLSPSVSAVFSSPYTTSESVFSFAFTTLDAPTTAGIFYNPPLNGSGHYPLNPAGILGNTGWKTTDARRALTQVRLPGPSTWLSNKWPKNPSNEADYMNVIRYAEVLLNLSEAIVRQNNTVDPRAMDLLNAIRQRSDPTTVFTVAGFATPQDLLDQIAIERRIELLGEGFRSFDRLRLGQPLLGKGSVPAIAPNDIQYIWPIPLNELLLNSEATQNPGY